MPAKFVERREECYLFNSVVSNNCRDELKEMDKHEIVSKIADIIGSCPTHFVKAEEIFEKLKFEITQYTLHHEYCKTNGIRSRLLVWLENKTNPTRGARLREVMDKYLK